MVQRSGMVDKECVCLLVVIILLIKEWTKVSSLCNFCAVDMGLFLEVTLARHLLFISLRAHDSLLLISTSVLVTKQ